MKRREVQDSALQQHSEEYVRLHNNHTTMNHIQAFGPELSMPVATTVAMPAAWNLPHPPGATAAGDVLSAKTSTAAGKCRGDTNVPHDTRTSWT